MGIKVLNARKLFYFLAFPTQLSIPQNIILNSFFWFVAFSLVFALFRPSLCWLIFDLFFIALEIHCRIPGSRAMFKPQNDFVAFEEDWWGLWWRGLCTAVSWVWLFDPLCCSLTLILCYLGAIWFLSWVLRWGAVMNFQQLWESKVSPVRNYSKWDQWVSWKRYFRCVNTVHCDGWWHSDWRNSIERYT